MSKTPSIEQRLEQLEHSLRQARVGNRVLATVLLGCVATVILATARPSESEPAGAEVRARAFVLVDEAGRTRGKLSMTDEGSCLMLMNETDQQRVSLVSAKTGPRLALQDEDNKVRLVVAAPKSGPTIALIANGVPRATLSDGSLGPRLNFNSPAGKPLSWIGEADGLPALVMLDHLEKVRVQLNTSKEDVSFMLQDDAERTRASFKVTNSRSQLSLFDKGKGSLIATVEDEHQPVLTLGDDTGVLRTLLTADTDGLVLFGSDQKPRWKAP